MLAFITITALSILVCSIVLLKAIMLFLKHSSRKATKRRSARKTLRDLLRIKCSPKINLLPENSDGRDLVEVKILYGGMHCIQVKIDPRKRVSDLVDIVFSETVPFERYKVALLFLGNYAGERRSIASLCKECEAYSHGRAVRRLVLHAVAKDRAETKTGSKDDPDYSATIFSFIFLATFLICVWAAKDKTDSFELNMKAEVILVFLTLVVLFALANFALLMATEVVA